MGNIEWTKKTKNKWEVPYLWDEKYSQDMIWFDLKLFTARTKVRLFKIREILALLKNIIKGVRTMFICFSCVRLCVSTGHRPTDLLSLMTLLCWTSLSCICQGSKRIWAALLTLSTLMRWKSPTQPSQSLWMTEIFNNLKPGVSCKTVKSSSKKFKRIWGPLLIVNYLQLFLNKIEFCLIYLLFFYSLFWPEGWCHCIYGNMLLCKTLTLWLCHSHLL